MAYQLVGTEPADSQSASGAGITPAWGTSQNRSAGNLLILQIAGAGTATLPSAPAGWSIAKQQTGTSCSASIFYKIAAGSDAAPTVAAVTSTVLSAKLNEFSGNASAAPVDQTGGGSGTTSPRVVTAGSADLTVGELVVTTVSAFYSSATGTKTSTDSLNNGATVHTTQNANTNVDHFDHCWGITTGNSSADSNSCAIFTTNLTGSAGAIVSFKLAGTTYTKAGYGVEAA